MEIELQNIEHEVTLTQETPHFRADLHVDGTKIGIIYNDGTGGNCCFLGDQEAYRATEKWVAANLKIDDEMAMDLDTYCFGIVFDLQARDEVRKELEKAVLVYNPAERTLDGYRYPGGVSITPRHIEQIRKKIAPGAKILNELPFDEAFELFKAGTEPAPDAEPHAFRT